MRKSVLYPLLSGLFVLLACDHQRVTDSNVVSWPTDERMQTLRTDLHIAGSGDDQKAIVICTNGQHTTLWSKHKADREEQLCGE